MSTRRFTTQEPCPLDGAPVDMMSICQPCRYFRGAASSRHEKHGWDVCCNWPRDGMHLAAPNEGHELPGVEIAVTRRLPIPLVFLAGFDEEGGETA
jgi:hypothetical protein